MKGTIKWFDLRKGYGFVTDYEGKDVFIHYTDIQMENYRYFNEGDIVNFHVVVGGDGRKRAIHVKPVVTLQMVADVLENNGLHLQAIKNNSKEKKYLVIDKSNNLQTDEKGISLVEVAEYAGFEIKELVA